MNTVEPKAATPAPTIQTPPGEPPDGEVRGVTDWRAVCNVPPAPTAIDPQMRHILPDASPTRRTVWIVAGLLSIALALVGGVVGAVRTGRVVYGTFPVFATGCVLIGRGLRGKWY